MVWKELITAGRCDGTVIKSTPLLPSLAGTLAACSMGRGWPWHAGQGSHRGCGGPCLPLREPEEHSPPLSLVLPSRDIVPRHHFPAGSLSAPKPCPRWGWPPACLCSHRRMHFHAQYWLTQRVPLPGRASFCPGGPLWLHRDRLHLGTPRGSDPVRVGLVFCVCTPALGPPWAAPSWPASWQVPLLGALPLPSIPLAAPGSLLPSAARPAKPFMFQMRCFDEAFPGGSVVSHSAMKEIWV